MKLLCFINASGLACQKTLRAAEFDPRHDFELWELAKCEDELRFYNVMPELIFGTRQPVQIRMQQFGIGHTDQIIFGIIIGI